MPVRSLLLGLLFGLTACSTGAVPGRDAPLVLVLGPTHVPAHLAELQAALEAGSGLRVQLRAAPSAEAALEELERGRAHAAILPLFDSLFAAELYEAVPIAQLLRGDGAASYEGELVVREGDGPTTLQELAGKRVGFVDRWSVTGFLLPAAKLRAANLPIETEFFGTHEGVIAAVRDGRVVAGATYVHDPAAPEGLRVLEKTGSIANEPVLVLPSVGASEREALTRALVGVKAPHLLSGVAGATGFQPTTAEKYREARATVDAAGQRVTSLVKGGWQRANEHRRPLWSYAP